MYSTLALRANSLRIDLVTPIPLEFVAKQNGAVTFSREIDVSDTKGPRRARSTSVQGASRARGCYIIPQLSPLCLEEDGSANRDRGSSL